MWWYGVWFRRRGKEAEHKRRDKKNQEKRGVGGVGGGWGGLVFGGVWVCLLGLGGGVFGVGFEGGWVGGCKLSYKLSQRKKEKEKKVMKST